MYKLAIRMTKYKNVTVSCNQKYHKDIFDILKNCWVPQAILIRER